MDGTAKANDELINRPGLGTHYVRSMTYGAEMVASLKFKSSSSSRKWETNLGIRLVWESVLCQGYDNLKKEFSSCYPTWLL